MLETVISGLTGLISPLSSITKGRRELKDNALRAISHALNETYLYYRDIQHGSSRDLDREAQLSKYWSAAAIPISHIDERLASICDYKSEFWVNPENWDNDRIDETGIELDKVRSKYRNLLNKKGA